MPQACRCADVHGAVEETDAVLKQGVSGAEVQGPARGFTACLQRYGGGLKRGVTLGVTAQADYLAHRFRLRLTRFDKLAMDITVVRNPSLPVPPEIQAF
jgi:hypothetical protein